MKEKLKKLEKAACKLIYQYRPDLEEWNFAGIIYDEDSGWYRASFTKQVGITPYVDLNYIWFFEEDLEEGWDK